MVQDFLVGDCSLLDFVLDEVCEGDLLDDSVGDVSEDRLSKN